jgi:hypothetical protein
MSHWWSHIGKDIEKGLKFAEPFAKDAGKMALKFGAPLAMAALFRNKEKESKK